MWDVTSHGDDYRIPVPFLLTHPVWDVTFVSAVNVGAVTFLLTHPVWDVTKMKKTKNPIGYFYSHIPCGM